MARVQNTLIGKASGSVGGATFSSWKGINVLKSKAQNDYSNPTDVQSANNSKFAVMVAFFKTIASYVRKGFKAGAVGKSEYNVFMQQNPYGEVVEGTAPDYNVDPELIVVSKGPESTIPMTTFTKAAAGSDQITVAWTGSSGFPAGALVYALAFASATGELVGSFFGRLYSEEDLTISGTGIGTNVATTIVHAFYVNPANGLACDSSIIPA